MSFMLVWAEYAKMNIWTEALCRKANRHHWLCPFIQEMCCTAFRSYRKRPGKHDSGTLEITVEIYNHNDVLVISDISELVVRCRDK